MNMMIRRIGLGVAACLVLLTLAAGSAAAEPSHVPIEVRPAGPSGSQPPPHASEGHASPLPPQVGNIPQLPLQNIIPPALSFPVVNLDHPVIPFGTVELPTN